MEQAQSCLQSGCSPPVKVLNLVFYLLLLYSLTGCHSGPPNSASDLAAIRSFSPHLLYLNRSPNSSFYVQVDAVQGTEPNDAVLAQLKEFLVTYCDKPEGITVVRGSVIPRQDALGLAPSVLVHRYCQPTNMTGTNEFKAFLEILYYDGRLCVNPEEVNKVPVSFDRTRTATGYTEPHNPVTFLRPFPGYVTVDRRYLSSWPAACEGLILIHETGHALGLTQNDAHGTNNHCRASECLMRSTIQVDLWSYLLGRGTVRQTNICEDCRADLLRGRELAPDANLRFVGGALVRSEEDYHVVSLPAGMKIFVGEPAQFSFAEFREEIRGSDNRTNLAASQNSYFAQVAGNGTNWYAVDYGMLRLARSLKDKDPYVRSAAEHLLPMLQNSLGQAYLAGNGPPKNPMLAVRWLRRAAQAGDPAAQRSLGQCLTQGTGTTINKLEAYKWLSLAAGQKNREAARERDLLGKQMTSADRDQALAQVKLFKKSFE